MAKKRQPRLSSEGSEHIQIHPTYQASPEATKEFFLEYGGGLAPAQYISEHVLSSKVEIVAAALLALDESGTEKSALVLGAGRTTDIPFYPLTESFDKVVAVDMDMQALQIASQTASGMLKPSNSSVSFIAADVTGVLGEVTRNVYTLMEEHDSYARIAPPLLDLFQSTQPEGRIPDLGDGYDLVCSHLLLSQLAVPLEQLHFGVVAAYEDGESPSARIASQGVIEALAGLEQRMQETHIAYLGEVLRPQGVLHFADTFTSLRKSPLWEGVRRSPILHPWVRERFTEQFTMLRPSKIWPFAGICEVESYTYSPQPHTSV